MGSKLLAAVAALILVTTVLIGAGASGIVNALFGSSSSDASGSPVCTPDGALTGTVAGLTAEQAANAATIIAVGKQKGVPERGWVIAIAAALQESQLRNLHYGDRDSQGLFQQRPSMGWGTPQQVTTPSYAAAKFYEHLLATPGWQGMSVTDAAQKVQQSGFPGAYARHENRARAIIASLSGVRCRPQTAAAADCDHIQAATPAAATAINYACGQRGLPYVWGGNGPQNGDAGFDCSGLTKAAYAAAGIALPRTADAQFRAGTRVPDGQPLLPGDLVYYGPPTHIRHVGLYLGHGNMLNAPDFGQPVQIDNYRYPGDDYAGATRPTR
ncbi:C40 family peptidase [Amycolatopsis sp. La24]|uniref:C40 family peptidase n=1 Tax=Amycolatopsis sp. La24 TaxID=3028304 RepID=UPI0023AFB88E|nr:C40 family peptidase [Amycolatopsis sp. La24]